MLFFRSIYYRRLTRQGLLFDTPMYLAGSLEAGNTWFDYDDVSTSDLIGAGSIFLDQVSLMPQAARDNGGFRPDLLQAVAELKPPVIRWPGGAFAEHYRWKDGIGPQSRRRASRRSR